MILKALGALVGALTVALGAAGCALEEDGSVQGETGTGVSSSGGSRGGPSDYGGGVLAYLDQVEPILTGRPLAEIGARAVRPQDEARERTGRQARDDAAASTDKLAREADSVAKRLAAVKPPDVVAAAHQQLVADYRLAATDLRHAARAAREDNPAAVDKALEEVVAGGYRTDWASALRGHAQAAGIEPPRWLRRFAPTSAPD